MRLAKIGAGIVAGAALLSGCWGQPGFGPGNTRHNGSEQTLSQANITSLTEKWSTDVSASYLSEPIVRGNLIYATAQHPADFLGVKSFNASTGAPGWETQVAGIRGGASAVAFSGQELWLSHNPGFCDANISRLDPDDGDVLGTEPAIVGGSIVTGEKLMAYVHYGACPPTDPGQLIVRDAGTRATLWTYNFPEANYPTVSNETVTMADGRIYVAIASTLYAFDEDCGASTCSPLWTRTFPGRTLDRAAAAGGRVYVSARFAPPVATGSAVLSALSATDGSTQWSRELERITGVAVTGANVFVIGAGPPANPAPDGVLFAFASTCGSPSGCLEWATGYGQEIPTSIAVAGNVLYVATKPAAGGDGSLLAYAPSGCGAPTCATPLVDLPIDGPPTGMSVADGRVLVTSQADVLTIALTAYGLP